ncbi:MAG: ribonuclease P protein component [Campylobacterota bacterium]|nr:ribonuclease P protein component [Campylobacterota bacterium]
MSSLKHFTTIKNSKEFNRVYKKATKTWHTPLFVLFYRKSEDIEKVGIVASKKIGNAIKRNRAKRLLRAVFIRNIDRLKFGEFVLVAKPPLLEANFEELEKSYLYALERSKAKAS